MLTDYPSHNLRTNGTSTKEATLKYLPGQRLLFAGDSSVETVSAEAVTELFYTGKDLPGAHETNQIILWDVA